MHIKLLLTIAAVVALLVVSITVFRVSGGEGDAQLEQGETLALNGVSTDMLEGEGIKLTVADSHFAATLSTDAATQAAKNVYPERKAVKETRLANVQLDNLAPPINRPLYVVSFDVSDVKMGMQGPPSEYLAGYAEGLFQLAFIDPQTGEFVHGTWAATPVYKQVPPGAVTPPATP
jgi:hypothetical protein